MALRKVGMLITRKLKPTSKVEPLRSGSTQAKIFEIGPYYRKQFLSGSALPKMWFCFGSTKHAVFISASVILGKGRRVEKCAEDQRASGGKGRLKDQSPSRG